ncbi:MAG: hypothetical protein M1815_004575, partial [Lichina confinis]
PALSRDRLEVQGGLRGRWDGDAAGGGPFGPADRAAGGDRGGAAARLRCGARRGGDARLVGGGAGGGGRGRVPRVVGRLRAIARRGLHAAAVPLVARGAAGAAPLLRGGGAVNEGAPVAVRVDGLHHAYARKGSSPIEALAGVSFEVRRGEVAALLGPNGSGKSTAFRVLATLMDPAGPAADRGRVEVFGACPWEDPAAVRGRIGVVFQSPGLDGELTAEENLRCQGKLQGLTGVGLREAVEEALRRSGQIQRRGDRVKTFSGGMKRRLEVAKAMLHGPELLLLDEPDAGLDPTARALLWEQLDALRREAGTTVLLTTHLMDLAARADRLVLLDRGHVVATGTAAELVDASAGEAVRLEPADRDADALAADLAGDEGLSRLRADTLSASPSVRLRRADAGEWVLGLRERWPDPTGRADGGKEGPPRAPAGPRRVGRVSGSDGAFGGPRRRMTDPRTVGLLPLDLLRSADFPASPCVLLHSARPHPEHARFSVLARPSSGGSSGIVLSGGEADGAFERLEEVAGDGALWLGFLGYDLARAVERLPATAADDRAWPALAFHRCAGWLEHDAIDGSWFACGDLAGREDGDVLAAFSSGVRAPDWSFHAGPATPDRSEEEHVAAVARAIRYVAAGDVFQVNVARRWGGRFGGSAASLYAALAAEARPWYGACLPLPGDRGTLCSASPELFLELELDGTVTTRPIKGTEPAGGDALEDSRKDAAELAMIVDLLRNDLGRVCRPGSIAVPEARAIEDHPTVRHGVATVRGTLRPEHGLAALLRATWPGGSITGAPKVRAMQVIEELEPVRRGPAYGAIGGIRREPGGGSASEGWRVKLSLAIRTVCVAGARYDFHVGGGVVAESTPRAELAETHVKAAALLRALRSGGASR